MQRQDTETENLLLARLRQCRIAKDLQTLLLEPDFQYGMQNNNGFFLVTLTELLESWIRPGHIREATYTGFLDMPQDRYTKDPNLFISVLRKFGNSAKDHWFLKNMVSRMNPVLLRDEGLMRRVFQNYPCFDYALGQTLEDFDIQYAKHIALTKLMDAYLSAGQTDMRVYCADLIRLILNIYPEKLKSEIYFPYFVLGAVNKRDRFAFKFYIELVKAVMLILPEVVVCLYSARELGQSIMGRNREGAVIKCSEEAVKTLGGTDLEALRIIRSKSLDIVFESFIDRLYYQAFLRVLVQYHPSMLSRVVRAGYQQFAGKPVGEKKRQYAEVASEEVAPEQKTKKRKVTVAPQVFFQPEDGKAVSNRVGPEKAGI